MEGDEDGVEGWGRINVNSEKCILFQTICNSPDNTTVREQ
jgi:hypothetical protein